MEQENKYFRRLQRDYKDCVGVFGIKMPMPIIGTNKVNDKVGMGIVLMLLNASLQVGKHYDTI